jgi:hypothetical protein
MDTNSNYAENLRNPAVDFDRSDLSARGILLFLAGLLVAGIFIELVLWGMFRFLAHSTIFVQGNQSALVQTQKAIPENAPTSILQNTESVNTNVFPEPRLQTNDVVDMQALLNKENKILYPEQPFEDSTGAVHIPINQAMALIVERGLPVQPNAPPREFGTAGAPLQSVTPAGAGPGIRQREKPAGPATPQ